MLQATAEIRSRFLLAAMLGCLAALPGCGSSGPARYDLSGKVTCNGKPVFSGYLYFLPDKDRGNDGPGTQIGFSEGQYKTAAGRGTIGGPHVVTITAYAEGPALPAAGPFGPDLKPPSFKLLCPPVQIKVDLPRQAATHDFEIPNEIPNKAKAP